MKSRVSDKELLRPHFVEWGVSPEVEDDDFEWKDFESRKEAIEFAHNKDSKRYAVWLGEIGTYTTDGGNQIRDWIYYWWNAKTDWPPFPERGGGYPFHAQSRAVSYTPHDQTDWKGR